MAMACSSRSLVHISGSTETLNISKSITVSGFCVSSLPNNNLISKLYKVSTKPAIFANQIEPRDVRTKAVVGAQTRPICVPRNMRWWDKTLKPNMIEIHSATELVQSLLNAGDRLVILDFYSPGCGGCKTIHPKICQIAESNPDAIIMKVNYEELKTMCYSLKIHVLPFFRFYRGAQGRLCSFSCTNVTIKKFKDALAKYGSESYGVGPAKGLDETEILELVSAGELPATDNIRETMEDLFVVDSLDLSCVLGDKFEIKQETAML